MTDAHKSERPGGAGQFAEESQSARIFSVEEIPGNAAKRLATLKAVLALRGHEVLALDGGAFLVARWGLTRRCADLTELHDFAQQIGAIT
jgi:hypothetical protein